MRIRTIEHVPFEGPGAITRFAARRGHGLERTRIFAGDPLPALDDLDFLIVLGGPMSVHDQDRFPWLSAEKRFVRQAAEAGRRVLGICLGAQILAEVLGGTVTGNPRREIGWGQVRLTSEGRAAPCFEGFPAEFAAFHWHGETFSIPPGASRLAGSEACANQAFCQGSRLVGLQFHLETTAENMELLIENCADELVPGPFVQSPEEMRAGLDGMSPLQGLLDTLLNTMTKEL